MNILIVVPRMIDSEAVNYNYMFPLGLAYISSSLKCSGHKVDCLNLNHHSGATKNIIDGALNAGKQYDFICTGGLSPIYNQLKSVVDAVRASNSCVGIVLGGGIISSEPELMFNELEPDYIVIGEGERTICQLFECLEKNQDIRNVPGIGYRDASAKFVCNKPQSPIMDLDSIPWPDFEAFEFEQYLGHMRPSDQYFQDLFDYPRVYPIICSRSCPFLCTFCYHPIGNKYRQRSIDSIMQELSVMLKRYRINTIGIYDELLSHDRAWIYEFCRRLKEILQELPWECLWGCQMRVDKVDDDMLKMMKDAGCYLISYGFESYSTKVLRSMKKHITPQQIDNAVKLTLKNNISVQGNFIFGDPAETNETATETLDYWKQNVEAGILFGFVNPFPGTEIYKKCLERGVIKDRVDFIANHIFDIINMPEALTHNEFMRLSYRVYMTRERYRIYADVLMVRKMENETYAFQVKCPHCQKVVEYSNYALSSKHIFFTVLYCRGCRRRYCVAAPLNKFLSKAWLGFYQIAPNLSYYCYKMLWPRRSIVKDKLKSAKRGVKMFADKFSPIKAVAR